MSGQKRFCPLADLLPDSINRDRESDKRSSQVRREKALVHSGGIPARELGKRIGCT
jgi:hypothetical protein